MTATVESSTETRVAAGPFDAEEYCRDACQAIPNMDYLWVEDFETTLAREEADKAVERAFEYIEQHNKYLGNEKQADDFAEIVRWFTFSTARLEMGNYADIIRLAHQPDNWFAQVIERLYELYLPVIRSFEWRKAEEDRRVQVLDLGGTAVGAYTQ